MLFVRKNTILMNYLYCILILLLSSLASSYPRQYSTDLNDFLNTYLRQRNGNSHKTNQDFQTGRQQMSRFIPLHYQHQLLQQPTCLPRIWTCGPGLPPCCPGLRCYDGNAKRGRHCVA